MTYDTERAAIEGWFISQWAAATPVGLDGHAFTPVANSVRLTIQSGDNRQVSFGRAGTNTARNVGIVQVEIYVEGGKGSATWRGYAETIETIFRNRKLAADGTEAASAASVLVTFGRDGQLPYIASKLDEAPLYRVTVNAPFWREESKA